MYYFNNKKIIKIISIIIIAILTFYTMVKSVAPIFEGLCKEKAINLATEIINFETSKVLEQYDYTSLVTIMENKEENTNILKTDIITINKISNEIALAVGNRIQNLSNEKVNVPLGAITGNKYLAGIGPNLEIKIISAGNIKTGLKTEFESKGINQTVYRIYLELTGEVSILTSYNTISEKVQKEVLLVETVIVGNVPETYLNLDKELNKINLTD